MIYRIIIIDKNLLNYRHFSHHFFLSKIFPFSLLLFFKQLYVDAGPQRDVQTSDESALTNHCCDGKRVMRRLPGGGGGGCADEARRVDREIAVPHSTTHCQLVAVAMTHDQLRSAPKSQLVRTI